MSGDKQEEKREYRLAATLWPTGGETERVYKRE